MSCVLHKLAARAIFDEMQARKSPGPNVFTYNILLSVLARNRDYDAAMELFEQVTKPLRCHIDVTLVASVELWGVTGCGVCE
eukprot:1180046-Prorocentrum_minimum.AAC.2